MDESIDIEVGTKISHFIAVDQDGDEFSSEDFIGTPYVLYFYPQDDTPGCTKEACSFRDHLEELENQRKKTKTSTIRKKRKDFALFTNYGAFLQYILVVNSNIIQLPFNQCALPSSMRQLISLKSLL